MSNTGFRGIGIQAGAEYVVSAYARAVGAGPQSVRVTLNDERGGRARPGVARRLHRRVEALRGDDHAHPPRPPARSSRSSSTRRATSISTWCRSSRRTPGTTGANGLRKDLVQLLADLKPGFIRFPGGCIVEGRRLELRYQWKKTVGDVAERRGLINRWADENDRIAPDYYQSFGLGFFEYFQLAEDIGASPLPILNCGMACQFNSGELAAADELDEYIQDALDLIEFANGPASSRWGGLRASMGHPAPFGLKMIGVGNEQWGPQYVERYERFAAALKAKHPEIQLVASAGPSPAGQLFEFLWGKMRELKADLVDEHYYMPPAWFLANATRYDKYERSGPKVFAGEYAAHVAGPGRPGKRNNWQAALAEAAFMTGLERNADVVRMASYAPLFAHVDAWQWAPDLIWFDNLRSFGTPSYYVQKIFGTNTGTRIAAGDDQRRDRRRAARALRERVARRPHQRDRGQGGELGGGREARAPRDRGRGDARRRPHDDPGQRRPPGRELPGPTHAGGAGGIAGDAGRSRPAPGTPAAVRHRGAAAEGTVGRARG